MAIIAAFLPILVRHFMPGFNGWIIFITTMVAFFIGKLINRVTEKR